MSPTASTPRAFDRERLNIPWRGTQRASRRCGNATNHLFEDALPAHHPPSRRHSRQQPGDDLRNVRDLDPTPIRQECRQSRVHSIQRYVGYIPPLRFDRRSGDAYGDPDCTRSDQPFDDCINRADLAGGRSIDCDQFASRQSAFPKLSRNDIRGPRGIQRGSGIHC